MTRWPIHAGVVLGLVLGLMALAFWPEPTAPGDEHIPAGPILSECDGAIHELVIHYTPEAAPIVMPVYRDLLGQAPAEIGVHVVVPDRAAFDHLRQRLGPVRPRLLPVLAGHAMTAWARDRWIARQPAKAGGFSTILCPDAENIVGEWPQRRGDQEVAFDLARALTGVWARRSRLRFDGGDFVADSRTVFVVPQAVERNLGRGADSRAEVLAGLARVAGREVTLLEPAPRHHAGMFLMFAGEGRAVVGDPAWGRRLLPAAQAFEATWEPDFSAPTQALFDAVARQCEARGYRVSRIPVVPGTDGRTYLTFVNALIDQRAGGRTIYMPVYEGVEGLNAGAEEVWRRLGFEVRRVDCTTAYRHFGSLHCLVNVLRRDPA